MRNYATYNGVTLKLTAGRAIEAEEKLGGGIVSKMSDSSDQLRVLSTILASSIIDGTYEERKNKALFIYDDMLEKGKDLTDYQFLVSDVLVAAGFMKGEIVEMQKKYAQAQTAILAENMKKMQEKEQAQTEDLQN